MSRACGGRRRTPQLGHVGRAGRLPRTWQVLVGQVPGQAQLVQAPRADELLPSRIGARQKDRRSATAQDLGDGVVSGHGHHGLALSQESRKVGVEGVGAVSTNFRGFGTQLMFTPTVLDKDRIRMHVAPSFSQVNQELASQGGVPGL